MYKNAAPYNTEHKKCPQLGQSTFKSMFYIIENQILIPLFVTKTEINRCIKNYR